MIHALSSVGKIQARKLGDKSRILPWHPQKCLRSTARACSGPPTRALAFRASSLQSHTRSRWQFFGRVARWKTTVNYTICNQLGSKVAGVGQQPQAWRRRAQQKAPDLIRHAAMSTFPNLRDLHPRHNAPKVLFLLTSSSKIPEH